MPPGLLLRKFCLNTRKGLASNTQFLLLTLDSPPVHTGRYFVAHMFTSYCHVADVVPADRRGERCRQRSFVRCGRQPADSLGTDTVHSVCSPQRTQSASLSSVFAVRCAAERRSIQ